MNKILFIAIIALSFTVFSCKEEKQMVLIYNSPAQNFGEALPLGNGRLGAMVYGNIHKEHLSLNDDTFWSGEPKDWNNPIAKEILPQMKEAIAKGDHKLADELAMKMQGPYTQSYQPLEDVTIEFEHTGEAIDYVRDLDLERALAQVAYKIGDTTYKRTYFLSFPDQVLVIRLESNKTATLNFTVGFSGKHQTGVKCIEKNILEARGKAPMHVDPNYLNTPNPVIYADSPEGKGINYASYIKIAGTDGLVMLTGESISVKNATEATLYITARTSFNGFKKSPSSEGLDCMKMALDDLEEIAEKPYEKLQDNHIKDYKKLFNRLDFGLGEKQKIQQPVEAYFDSFKNHNDGQLAVLAFQMGRYMAIAGSRPGSQPLNLQGIWNEAIRPPWSSNYTVNINTQMNYWPVLATNLAECNEPLLQLIEEVAENGKETARINYDCKGWVAHHNIDLWRQSALVGDGEGEACWANFTGGGVWLTMHIWEHYLFTQDKTFLKEKGYPVLKGAVEFIMDWLEVNDKGYYVPPFAVSTEATYVDLDGYKGYCAKNSAEDLALNGELLLNFIAACDTLGIKDELYTQAKKVLEHIDPYEIDPEGKIQEWLEEGLDRPEGYNKNHLSHLIGFHPGRHLIVQKSQAYIDAVRRTLELFGPSSGGWNLAWQISFWARLKESEKAYDFVKRSVDRFSPNLFSGGKGFQIDANMGYVAGICEMLVQSHLINDDGAIIIELLPALPKEWPSGYIKGICVRGGYEVDIEWNDSKIEKAIIKNISNNTSPVPVVEIVHNQNKLLKQIPYQSQIVIK
ncbi:glycoside hydrolase family 95 protein [Parabacteroides sp. OttesenSCG-928-K15]|nr:glycoside hydrolase family 95 protein [Parabacteroides sp. OttesenSCG-928-K15]